jgi:ubiquinone/menaquinone biosynthesis C-methylase UbiE
MKRKVFEANLRYYENEGWQRISSSNRRQMAAHLRQLIELIELPAGTCVMDVGTGAGFALSLMRRHLRGYSTLLGADISYKMLQCAKGNEKEATFVQVEGERLPIESETCGAVFFVSVLHHVYAPLDTLVAESARILCAKGYLVIAQEPNRFVNGALNYFRKLLGLWPAEETTMAEYHQFKTNGIPIRSLIARLEQFDFDVLKIHYTNAALADELENKLGGWARVFNFFLLHLQNPLCSLSYSLVAQKRTSRNQ